MTFLNLYKNPVKIDKKTFLNAVNRQSPMAITPSGDIFYGAIETLPPQPYIYVGQPASLTGSSLSAPTPLTKILGDNYDVEDEGETISIDVSRAWQELLTANEPFCLYQDTTADGITEFSDQKMDELLWHCCEFDIQPREVAEFLEKNVKGTVICLEVERPYSFNGCAFVENLDEAYEKAYTFLRQRIREKIASKEIDPKALEADQEEALRFFDLDV